MQLGDICENKNILIKKKQRKTEQEDELIVYDGVQYCALRTEIQD